MPTRDDPPPPPTPEEIAAQAAADQAAAQAASAAAATASSAALVLALPRIATAFECMCKAQERIAGAHERIATVIEAWWAAQQEYLVLQTELTTLALERLKKVSTPKTTLFDPETAAGGAVDGVAPLGS